VTRVHQDELTLPAATLGPDDPLPVPHRLLENPFELSDEVPPQIQHGAGFGRPRSMHPYLLQNHYTRNRSPRTLPTAVLDNGYVRATFTPTLGGRLWSLIDHASGRELLHANTVLQPANLALRNAWFAGGVEWNIGTKGHAAHTMAPLHTATLTGPDGAQILRMWEFDRLRQVIFQVDACLPHDSRALQVYVRIQNPNDHDVPMYWWSNAAVPEAEDVRVLAPATQAYATSYDGAVRVVPVPVHQAVDRTWSTRSRDAADYFYDVSASPQPWIASVDGTGHGLAQASTSRLMGRKLFLWGTGPGGQRWQEWLSPGQDRGYLEIQAGLLATQFEHVMMPAGASWDWVEVYGDVAADPGQAHSTDWRAAVAHTEERIHALTGGADLNEVLARARTFADAPPEQMISLGSGWGALEARMRRASGQRWLADDGGTPFGPKTLGAEQELWAALVDDPQAAERMLAGANPLQPPPSYVTGQYWQEALAAMPPGWLRDYHLAVLAHARGADSEAEEWYRSSVDHRPSAWALRGRALIATTRGEHQLATDLLESALELTGDQPTLLLEAITAARAAGQPERALVFVDQAAPALRDHGRVRLLEGFAAVEAGERDRAEAVLEAGVEIPDLREGELALSDLWAAVHPGRPVPAHYDFRMRQEQS